MVLMEFHWLSQEKPDLILVDIQLSGYGLGMLCARELRKIITLEKVASSFGHFASLTPWTGIVMAALWKPAVGIYRKTDQSRNLYNNRNQNQLSALNEH
jgi:hypothetical protein